MPIEYYSPISGGAISTIIMQTAHSLIERGHQVSVLTITNDDNIYAVGNVIPILARKRGDLNFLQRRLSALRSKFNQWDWPYYEFYLRSFQKALRELSPTPDVVVLFNDLVSPKYVKSTLPASRVFVWLQNEQRTRQEDLSRPIASTDKFLTCSGYIRDWTTKAYNIPLVKFAVVPSGVDLDAFYPRKDFLERSSPLRVLFIGRIDPNKGPDIAADAVAALQAEGMQITFTVAGGLWFYKKEDEMGDPYFRSLKNKMDAAKADYRGHVVRAELPQLVREHDVVCVLSRSNEPFGLVALEAMASGCAVISSERGGLPEACGDAAMLVNPDDLQNVIHNLRQLATDHALLRSQKMKSVVRAFKAPWSATANILEQVLKS